MQNVDDVIAIVKDKATSDVISVSWDSSSVCNYRCTYCEENFNGGHNLFPPIEKVVRFLDKLQSTHKKNIYIELKGGEPTLWKELPQFLRICHERQWGISLITNGSKPLKWWQENSDFIPLINMSLHPEYFDLEKMDPVIDFLYNSRQLGLLYLMYPAMFDKAKSDIRGLISKYPSVDICPLIVGKPKSNGAIYEYTEEQSNYIEELQKRIYVPKQWPRKLPFDEPCTSYLLNTKNEQTIMRNQQVKIADRNRWRGWMCKVGLERIHISVEGDIFRGQCMEGDLLGNLHKEDYTFPTKPIQCNKEICFCGLEMSITKWNPKVVSIENSGLETLVYSNETANYL